MSIRREFSLAELADYANRYPDIFGSGYLPGEHLNEFGERLNRSVHPTARERSDALVTVMCVTYNHAAYIRQAMDSILCQKTDFDFILAVFDDCSTDGTSEIIREYAKRYPNIRACIRAKNIGASANFIDAVKSIDTLYVALCDGDDYWTDPCKLQKQVDALQADNSATICFHQVEIVDDSGNALGYYPAEAVDTSEPINLLKSNYIQTNSVVYRWRPDAFKGMDENAAPLDWLLHLQHAELGRIIYISEIMAVYRKHSGGIWARSWDIVEHRQRYGVQQIVFFEIVAAMFGGIFGKFCRDIEDEIFSTILFTACYTGDFTALEGCLRHRLRAAFQMLTKIGVDCSSIHESNASDIATAVYDALSVTVVVTCFNQEHYIEQCLRSVLCQRGIKFDVVFGDDASKDSTFATAMAIFDGSDTPVKVLHRASNLGMLPNLKECLSQTSGRFVAICEGDDYWLSDRRLLKHVLTLAMNKKAGLSFNWILIDDEISRQTYPHGAQAALHNEACVKRLSLINDNVIGNFSCCVYRAEALRSIDDRYWKREGAADWLFNLFVSANWDIIFVRELLSVYRLHRSGQWSGLSHLERKRTVESLREDYSRTLGFDLKQVASNQAARYRFTLDPACDRDLSGFIEKIETGPDLEMMFDQSIEVRGWVFDNAGRALSLQVEGDEYVSKVVASIERADVLLHHGFHEDQICSTLFCGFSFYVPIRHLPVTIKACAGDEDIIWGSISPLSQE